MIVGRVALVDAVLVRRQPVGVVREPARGSAERRRPAMPRRAVETLDRARHFDQMDGVDDAGAAAGDAPWIACA